MFAVLLAAALATLASGPKVEPPPPPPPVHGRFDYQIGGSYKPAAGVAIVDRDRSAKPAGGRYSICYVNAFQAQTNELGWWRKHHPHLLLDSNGNPVIDQGWDEQLLDTSTAKRRRGIAKIEGRWIDGCASAGFRAVEPDNLDSWTRSQRLLTRKDNLALARLLVMRAHSDGLAIAQKNTPQLGTAGRKLGFDFAIAEECQVYDECDAFTKDFGAHVIEIEYTDNGGIANFQRACQARGASISILYRDRDVVPRGQPGYVSRWC
ncbi:MAG: endo alpha-1,4 polygalactosaminidase [Actinobacteria bacterium]|nr:endo alpha-1,4 polygalactosaminidase [Actinomycetota bacterium]